MSDEPKKEGDDKSQPHQSEEPSMVRKAQSAYDAHQASVELRQPLGETPSVEEGYKPKWENKIEFDAAQMQEASQGADHFDRLINQIIHQQKGLQQQKQHGFFYRESGSLLKIAVAILAIGGFWWMYTQKQRLDKERSMRQRFASGESTKITVDKLKEIFKNEKDMFKVLRKKGRGQDRRRARNPKYKRSDKPSTQMAAKLMTTLESRQIDSDWNALLVCSTSSPWSGYHTQGFHKLADDLVVYQFANDLYIFTPYYAAKEAIYDGFFWEKKWHDVVSKFGGDYRANFPQQSLAIPYNALVGLHDLGGYFYLDSRRGLPLEAQAPFVFGSLREDIATHTLSTLKSSAAMWPSSELSLKLDQRAAGLVQAEVLNQVAKFKANKYQPFFRQTSDHRRLEKAGISEVLTACRKAAKGYNLAALDEVSRREQRRLTKYTSYRGRYVFKARVQQATPGLSMRLLNSVVALNLPMLRGCMNTQDAKTRSIAHRWPFQISINKSGRVFNIRMRKSRRGGRGASELDRCIAGAVKAWKFPPTFDQESGKALLDLNYY